VISMLLESSLSLHAHAEEGAGEARAQQSSMPPKSIEITGGDPRRPGTEVSYVRPRVSVEEQPPDFVAILGMFAGMYGMIMKSKLGCWIALLSCVNSLTTLKQHEADVKQILSMAVFAVMGLVSNYFGKKAG